MEPSDHRPDLKTFFPFSCCESSVLTKALELGKCVKYTTGESVLLSGSPAKHCGLILSGQAVAFKMDENGRRYQLCLDEGCLIGLETLTPENVYSAKVTAITDILVFFWNASGIKQLIEEDPDFSAAMHILDEGRIYQEKWLIPETDITDPVLCARQQHWLSIIAPVFAVIPLLLICLAVTGLLIRRYTAAWLLVFPLLGASGSFLYKEISARLNEYVIITSKNLILVPKNNEEPMSVTRLFNLESIDIHQNIFGRMFGIGKISIESQSGKNITPSLKAPDLIASLIHDASVRAAKGRTIPLRNGREPFRKKQVSIPADNRDSGISPKKTEQSESSPFTPIRMHAHWALLLRMIFKPLVVMAVALYAAWYFRTSTYADVIQKLLFIGAAFAAVGAIYQICSWRNHRFIIEEDCIKDYERKPFSKENLNIAMNHKIQSVYFEKQGFFQVLLNYGTVYILAGEGELVFEYVNNPEKVQQTILDTCARYEAKLRLEEEARRKAYISDLFHEIKRETEIN